MAAFACLFVCAALAPAAHLSHFWRDMEASEVNGELKQNVSAQCGGGFGTRGTAQHRLTGEVVWPAGQIADLICCY